MVFWVGDEMRSLFNLCNYVCLKIFLSLHPLSQQWIWISVGAYACWFSFSTLNGLHIASRLKSVAPLLTVVRCFYRATEIRIYIFAVHLAIASKEFPIFLFLIRFGCFFFSFSSFPLSLCQYTTLSLASAEFTMNAMPKDEDRATYSTYQSKNAKRQRRKQTHATPSEWERVKQNRMCQKRWRARAPMPPPLIGRQKIQINE